MIRLSVRLLHGPFASKGLVCILLSSINVIKHLRTGLRRSFLTRLASLLKQGLTIT